MSWCSWVNPEEQWRCHAVVHMTPILDEHLRVRYIMFQSSYGCASRFCHCRIFVCSINTSHLILITAPSASCCSKLNVTSRDGDAVPFPTMVLFIDPDLIGSRKQTDLKDWAREARISSIQPRVTSVLTTWNDNGASRT